VYSETIATGSGLSAGNKGRAVAVNLNEIHRLVGELGGTVKGIENSLQDLKKDIADSEKNSATSRANVHRRLDEVVLRTATLETEVSQVKIKIEDIGVITDNVRELSQKAQGAGLLGKALLRIGIALITIAGWLFGVYQYFSGGR